MKLNYNVFNDTVEVIKIKEDIDIGNFFYSIKDPDFKVSNKAYLFMTKYPYNGMQKFILFYKFKKLQLHHSTGRNDFKFDDIKGIPVYEVRVAKDLTPFDFYIESENFIAEIDDHIFFTYSELNVILNFIEQTDDLKKDNITLREIYNILIDKYFKYEIFAMNNKDVELNIKFYLNIKQCKILYEYLSKQFNEMIMLALNGKFKNGLGHKINLMKNLKNITNKIEVAAGKNVVNDLSVNINEEYLMFKKT